MILESMIYGVDYETRTLSGVKLLAEERSEQLRCGACGRRVESLSNCVWDERLSVGPCCETYTENRCPACGSDNLEFRSADVRCLECHCVTTEASCEVHIGPFELTSPTELPRLHQIRIRPVRVAPPEDRKSGAA